MTSILPLHFQPDITIDIDEESDELVAVTRGVVYGMRYYTTDCGRWVIRYHTDKKNWESSWR